MNESLCFAAALAALFGVAVAVWSRRQTARTMRRLENMHYERLPSLLPEECDGCGACSYVCPAGRDVTAKVLEAGQTQGTIFLNWGDDDDA